MSLPAVLAQVRARPGMYLPKPSYDNVTSFVLGCDAALQGGMLLGFREWLIAKLDDGNNLSWPALVRALAKKVANPADGTAQDEKVLVELMFSTIEQFIDERNEHDGLRRIYAKYEAWLRRQDWYGPSSPQWIPPNE